MEIKSIFGNYEISESVEKMTLINKLGINDVIAKSKRYELYKFNNEILVVLLSSCAKVYHYNLKSKLCKSSIVFDVLIECYKHINVVLTKLKNRQKQIDIKNGISDGKHTRLMNNIKINDIYFCEQNKAYGDYDIKLYEFFIVTEVLKSSIKVVMLPVNIKQTKSGIKHTPVILHNINYYKCAQVINIKIYKNKPMSLHNCELKKLKTSFIKG